jgi:protein TonB
MPVLHRRIFMQRPSHNIPALTLQSVTRRFGGAGIAAIAQLSFAAVIAGGIVDRVTVQPPPPLEVARIKQIDVKTPPPLIKVEKAVMPTVAPPLIDIAPDTSGTPITTVLAQTPVQTLPVVTRQPPVVAVADRAATAVPGTHTSPPYPTLARRLGAQGKVMLRLTVLPDGAVGKAEVTASSGRQDLDQAAAQWITGHWTYQPAIRNGAPAASQVLAAVQFSLSDAR